MIGMQGKELCSQRLRYRLLEEGDKAALFQLLRDREVTAPAGFLPAENEAAFDVFIDRLTQNHTGIAVLMGEKLIGYCHVNPYRPDVEELKEKMCVGLGFVIGKDFQQKGYGTEMLKTVTEYLLSRFDACFADCFSENDPSRKTIEKCGYRYVETYPMYFEELGEEKNCLSYMRMK